MSALLIGLVLASALLHATWNALIKGGRDKLLETALNTNGGALVALCLLPFLPLPNPACLPYLAGTAGIHIFYYLFLVLTYKEADFSRAYTLMRGAAPLLTAGVGALLLDESLSFGGRAGVCLLSLGVLVLACNGGSRAKGRRLPFFGALAGAATITAYTLVDGRGVRLSGSAYTYVCLLFCLNTLSISLFTLAVRRRAYISYVQERWTHGLFGGTCSLAAYGIVLWAMTRAPVAQVAALRETSVVFGMLLAMAFLKEHLSLARATAVLLVLAGAAVMRLWG